MKFVTLRKKSIIAFCIASVLVTLLIVGIGLTGSAQVWGGQSTRKLPIYCVDKGDEKSVAISFDACWGNEKTAGILETLEKHDVKANYFVVGSWAEQYKDDLKMLADSGRVEIGTHSNTHPHMPKLSVKQMELELTTSNAIIENITGKKVELFRAPFGDYSDAMLKTAEDLGLYTIQWDVDSLDWKDLSAGQITNRILNGVKPGSIVLMHNDGKNTLAALPAIIEGLKNKGYSFVTIGELIMREDYTIDHTGRQIRR